MLQDIQDYDHAKQAVESGEELIPSEVTDALIEGQSPIRVWRTYRGLTQQQLAEVTGISKAYLSQLESGKRTGTAEVLSALTKALKVSIDDLLEG